jgi:hypothetical protein
VVIVVARHDHHVRRGTERTSDCPQYRPCSFEGIAYGPVTKLEHVPEQDKSIDGAQARSEASQGLIAAQHVAARVRAEVQVGDDQRAQ